MFKVILIMAAVVVGFSSCSFSQSQHSDETIVSEDYQNYLIKKQELILFEKARTAKELKDWK